MFLTLSCLIPFTSNASLDRIFSPFINFSITIDGGNTDIVRRVGETVGSFLKDCEPGQNEVATGKDSIQPTDSYIPNSFSLLEAHSQEHFLPTNNTPFVGSNIPLASDNDGIHHDLTDSHQNHVTDFDLDWFEGDFSGSNDSFQVDEDFWALEFDLSNDVAIGQ